MHAHLQSCNLCMRRVWTATEEVDFDEASTRPMIVLPGSVGFSARDCWAGICKLTGTCTTKREIKVLAVHGDTYTCMHASCSSHAASCRAL